MCLASISSADVFSQAAFKILSIGKDGIRSAAENRWVALTVMDSVDERENLFRHIVERRYSLYIA